MAKQYVINQTRQLIDLNDNLINFKISFRVAVAPQSNNASVPVFDVAVVDQSTVNSNIDNIQYNHITSGEFSGDIENANNVFQSWYLVLKAPQEISVWVDIQKEEIAPAIPNNSNNPLPPSLPPLQSPSYNWTAIVLVVLIIIGGGWWYLYGRKKGEEEDGDVSPSSASSSSRSKSSKRSKASKASKETSSESDNHSTFAMSPTSAKILERIRK